MKRNSFLKNGIGIGAGSFGAAMISSMVTSFFAFYLTDIMYLGAGIVGIILAVSAVVDGITDFGMGVLEDNTNSRWGKARGWILVFALPYAMSAALLFVLPASFGAQAKLIYVCVTYTLYCLFHTVVALPVNTLTSLVTSDMKERAVFSTITMFFSMATGMIVSLGLSSLLDKMGGGAHGYRGAAILFAVIGTVFLFICVFCVREKRISSKKEPFSRKEMARQLRALFSNKYWWLMNLCATFNSFGFMIITSMQTYYCQYILGDFSKIGVVFSCATLSQMIAMPFCAPVIARFGKKKTVIGSGLLSLLGYAIILLNTADFRFLCVGLIVRGVLFAPVNACEAAFFADTVDYGEYRNGVRQDGLVFSVKATLNKIVGSLITAGLGFALQFSGYSGALETQPAQALATIKWLFLLGPIVAYTLCIISYFLMDLDKKMPQILETLENRHAQS
ncbi:MAG: glycoside-pentoside-hexuronide (GPH):cation symporter [Lachnospiraceae bacterium]|nr:glycoside-pentoside-hexuronide (GPH):cation symporter [Lachnospiraceae bacterium]